MLVMKSYRGSISHNLYVPSSDPDHIDDVDLFEVYIAPVDYYIGIEPAPQSKRSFQKIEGVYDTAGYELLHFVRMCINCNPNIITSLFLNKEHYIETSAYWEELLKIREAFLSKFMYNTFSGYAKQERIRMEKSITGEKKYLGYMGEKRKELVTRYGYDTKNACNVVRLITMAIETLTTGKMNVCRHHDREELLAIKQGKVTMKDVLTKIKELEDKLLVAGKCNLLPEKPDTDQINKTVIGIMRNYISNRE